METNSYNPNLFKKIFKKIGRFFNKYYRSKRYFLVIPCEVTLHKTDRTFSAHIINISLTGLFIETKEIIDARSTITIDFKYQGDTYYITAKQVSGHIIISSKGTGAEFLFDKFHKDQKETLERLINNIKTADPKIPFTE